MASKSIVMMLLLFFFLFPVLSVFLRGVQGATYRIHSVSVSSHDKNRLEPQRVTGTIFSGHNKKHGLIFGILPRSILVPPSGPYCHGLGGGFFFVPATGLLEMLG